MPIPRLSELQLHEIDLHLHNGTERPEQYTSEDFLDYYVAAGRKVMGVTDHWGAFFPRENRTNRHYPPTPEGFQAFASDVKRNAAKYPDTLVLLGPEVRYCAQMEGVSHEMFSLPELDFFIGEPAGGSPDMRYGDYLIWGIEWIVDLRERYGLPSYLAHPLRHAVNTIVGRVGRDEDGRARRPNVQTVPPLKSVVDPLSHVGEYFDIDIRALGEVMVRHELPIELNQSTIGRALAQNSNQFIERYLFFYRTLLDMGVTPVLSSDMHGIESPRNTSFTFAQLLGIEVKDIVFLRHWLKD